MMDRREFTTRATMAAASLVVPWDMKASPTPLRVAIIGHTGRGDFGHGLDVMWQRIAGTAVVAISDPDADGRAAVQRKFRGVRPFADYLALLRETQPDIVTVAPRHADQHHAMTLAAIAAGARGIYLEKPFCRTPREADDIVAACAAHRVTLAVAHRNRYHPVLPRIRELVEIGEIGTLLEIHARGKEDARGGAEDLWVLGGHLLNIADWIAGPPVACSAMLYQDNRPCTRNDVRDGPEAIGPIAGNRVHARFEMEKGPPFFFDSIQDRGTRASGFGLQLVGTTGVIDLRMDEEPLAHLRRGHPYDPRHAATRWLPITTAGVDQREPMADIATPLMSHQLAGDDLVESLRDERAPLCDAHAGAAIVEMTCAVFESHCRGGAVVTLPLDHRDHPLVRDRADQPAWSRHPSDTPASGARDADA
jgi:predicted dehydrogenase